MEIKSTDSATSIRAFWIDLGNVLFYFDYAIFIEKIKHSLTLSPTQTKDLIFNSAFSSDFERGVIDEEEYYRQFCDQTGLRIQKDYFFEAFSDIFWENTPFIKFIKDYLRPTYRLIMVSNINKLHFQFLQNNYPAIFKLFDHLILSYKVKAMKPDTAIYDAALKVSDAALENVVYIDDREDLIQTTTERGIESIRFRSTQDCIVELNKKGVGA